MGVDALVMSGEGFDKAERTPERGVGLLPDPAVDGMKKLPIRGVRMNCLFRIVSIHPQKMSGLRTAGFEGICCWVSLGGSVSCDVEDIPTKSSSVLLSSGTLACHGFSTTHEDNAH